MATRTFRVSLECMVQVNDRLAGADDTDDLEQELEARLFQALLHNQEALERYITKQVYYYLGFGRPDAPVEAVRPDFDLREEVIFAPVIASLSAADQERIQSAIASGVFEHFTGAIFDSIDASFESLAATEVLSAAYIC